MKKRISGIVLPLAVVAFAVFGAFSTKAMERNRAAVVANETGWYHLSPTQPCIESSMCNIQGTDVCTVNNVPGQQLYRRLAATSCEFTLYKPQ